MIEALVGACILSVGVLIGLSSGYYRYMKSRETHLAQVIEAANKNLATFTDAYKDSSTKAAAIEQRLASLEFKMTGFTQSMGVKR